MRSFIPIIVMAVFLSGCAYRYAIDGSIEGSPEVFTGVISGATNHPLGELKMISNKGADCLGRFTRDDGRSASGVIACKDGRGGTFQLINSFSDGRGFGTLGGEPFKFSGRAH